MPSSGLKLRLLEKQMEKEVCCSDNRITYGIMVIIVENKHRDMSSNPGQG